MTLPLVIWFGGKTETVIVCLCRQIMNLTWCFFYLRVVRKKNENTHTHFRRCVAKSNGGGGGAGGSPTHTYGREDDVSWNR